MAVPQRDVDRLVTLAKESRLAGDALDDAVFHSCQEETLEELNSTVDEDEQDEIITESEHRGSNINQGGFENQIEYLLEGNDYPTVEQLIRDNAPGAGSGGG